MQKLILILTLIVTATISAPGQDSMVVLTGGSLVKPAANAPLSNAQAASAVGNAGLVRGQKGDSVCLVTAAHVAEKAGAAHAAIVDGVACLQQWSAASFPNAAALPQVAPFRERVPIAVTGWSAEQNEAIVCRDTPRDLPYAFKDAMKEALRDKLTPEQKKRGVEPDAGFYWQTRYAERANYGAKTAEEMLLGPKSNGALVLQDGKAVGVVISTLLWKGRERIIFRLLVPKHVPNGLYPPSG